MNRKNKSALVQPLHKRILYAATAVLWVTGTIWFFLNRPGEQKGYSLLQIHGAAAMVFLMVFGILAMEHVPGGWSQEASRPSGLGLLIASGLLVITGWGLYYLGNDILRGGTHWVHSVTGLAFPLLIYLHVRIKRNNI